MLAVDEDLRNAGAAVGAAHHLVPLGAVLDDVDVLVLDALALQQALRPRAVGAEHGAVDLDAGHWVSRCSHPYRDPLNVGYAGGVSRELARPWGSGCRTQTSG